MAFNLQLKRSLTAKHCRSPIIDIDQRFAVQDCRLEGQQHFVVTNWKWSSAGVSLCSPRNLFWPFTAWWVVCKLFASLQYLSICLFKFLYLLFALMVIYFFLLQIRSNYQTYFCRCTRFLQYHICLRKYYSFMVSRYTV